MAYRNTDFRCGLFSESMVLRVGIHSAELAELYAASGHRSAAFITACNPRSESTSDVENLARHQALGVALTQLDLPIVEGIGVDPNGHWPGEASYFVLGIDLDAASALGQQFDQNAVVWVGRDAIPQLVLLR